MHYFCSIDFILEDQDPLLCPVLKLPNIESKYRQIGQGGEILSYPPKERGPPDKEITVNSHSSIVLLGNYEVLICGGDTTAVCIVSALNVKSRGRKHEITLLWEREIRVYLCGPTTIYRLKDIRIHCVCRTTGCLHSQVCPMDM